MKGGVAIASVNELIVLSASADAAAAVAGTTMSSGVGVRCSHMERRIHD